jgi:hypothetical protein
MNALLPRSVHKNGHSMSIAVVATPFRAKPRFWCEVKPFAAVRVVPISVFQECGYERDISGMGHPNRDPLPQRGKLYPKFAPGSRRTLKSPMLPVSRRPTLPRIPVPAPDSYGGWRVRF